MDNKISDEEIENLKVISETMILSGEVTGDIWTGYPNSKFINQMLIRNPQKLEEYKTKIIALENMIKNTRMTEFGVASNKIMNVSRKIANLRKEINDNMGYYEFDRDAYLIYLVRSYEELKKNNPDEIKKMSIDLQKYFNGMVRTSAESSKPIYTLVFSEITNEYEVIVTTTMGKEKRMTYPQSEEKLRAFVKLVTEKAEITDEDIVDVLNYFNIKTMVSDVFSLVKDYDFADFIYTSVFCNYLKDCGVSKDEIASLSSTKELLYKSEYEYGYNNQTTDISSKLQTEYMLKYLNYIDVDKLVLLYLYRSLNSFERIECNMTGEQELESYNTGDIFEKDNNKSMVFRGDGVLEYMRAEKELLDRILKSRFIHSSTKIIVFSNDGEEHKINLNYINELMKKFHDGIYIIPPMIEFIKHSIFINEADGFFTPDIIKELDFSKEELIYLCITNISDLKKFYKCGVIDKQFILELVERLATDKIPDLNNILETKEWGQYYEDIIRQERIEPNLIGLINGLKKEELIDENDIKSFYENCYFELEDLEKIDFDEAKFEELITEEEMLESYKKYIDLLLKLQKVPSSEEKEELEKLRILKERKLALYKRFKLKNMTPEEQKENAENIILNYYADLEVENLDEYITESLVLMYKDGIVDFESIINADESFLKNIIIERMLKRGELSLADTAKIRESVGLENIKKIVEEALEDNSIDENQKFILVMNMFYRTSKVDTALRIKYLNKFRYENYKGELSFPTDGEIVTNLETDSNYGTNSNSNSNFDYEKRGYPDNVKWILFYSLDPDIQIKKFANGFVRVYSPKLQRYITEKYYEVDSKTHKIKSLAYGVATRNIDKTKYDMNIDIIEEISSDGLEVINEKELRKVSSKAECVRHNTRSIDKNWMRAMVANLGINLEVDTRYTNQELDLLRKTIENYERMYITL